jgi:ribonuclease D
VRRLTGAWLNALSTARALADEELPSTPPSDGPPPPHRWAERDPEAAARLVRCRELVTSLATAHRLPPENLITPDTVRRLAWTPPEPLDEETVREVLAGFGARHWQVELTAPGLTEALGDGSTSSSI